MMRRLYSPYETLLALHGTKEIAGGKDNPLILAMLQTDAQWPEHDEVAWCAAAVNFVCKLWGLPRTKTLAARDWLKIGEPIRLIDATPGFDVVVLKRGDGEQPGPAVFDAPGHVGFFAGLEGAHVLVLGGNQGNQVSIAPFPLERLLGLRRLA
jgi:uncharacterized protein (TIGR02594 family)